MGPYASLIQKKINEIANIGGGGQHGKPCFFSTLMGGLQISLNNLLIAM